MSLGVQEQHQLQIYFKATTYFCGWIVKNFPLINKIKYLPQFSIFSEIKQKEDNEVVSLGVQEQHQLRVAKAVRQQTVEKLWEITEKLNILYKDNWTALAEREMVKFQMELFTQTQKAEGSAVTGTGSQTRDVRICWNWFHKQGILQISKIDDQGKSRYVPVKQRLF